MADRTPEELLVPLVRAAARLLRVESSGPHALTLRFDRGALEVQAANGAVELAWLGGEPPDPEAATLDEAEPWWALLGQPLRGAWSRRDSGGRRQALLLELRAENPRRVALEARGRLLVARAEQAHAHAGEAR